MTYAAVYTDDLLFCDPPLTPNLPLAADATTHENSDTFDIYDKYRRFFDKLPEVRAYYRDDAPKATPATPISSPDGYENSHLNVLPTNKEKMGKGQGHGDTGPGNSIEEEPTFEPGPDETGPHYMDPLQCGPGTGDTQNNHV